MFLYYLCARTVTDPKKVIFTNTSWRIDSENIPFDQGPLTVQYTNNGPMSMLLATLGWDTFNPILSEPITVDLTGLSKKKVLGIMLGTLQLKYSSKIQVNGPLAKGMIDLYYFDVEPAKMTNVQFNNVPMNLYPVLRGDGMANINRGVTTNITHDTDFKLFQATSELYINSRINILQNAAVSYSYDTAIQEPYWDPDEFLFLQLDQVYVAEGVTASITAPTISFNDITITPHSRLDVSPTDELNLWDVNYISFIWPSPTEYGVLALHKMGNDLFPQLYINSSYYSLKDDFDYNDFNSKMSANTIKLLEVTGQYFNPSTAQKNLHFVSDVVGLNSASGDECCLRLKYNPQTRSYEIVLSKPLDEVTARKVGTPPPNTPTPNTPTPNTPTPNTPTPNTPTPNTPTPNTPTPNTPTPNTPTPNTPTPNTPTPNTPTPNTPTPNTPTPNTPTPNTPTPNTPTPNTPTPNTPTPDVPTAESSGDDAKVPTGYSDSKAKKKLSSGGAAGIAIFVVLAVIGAAVTVIVFIMRKKKAAVYSQSGLEAELNASGTDNVDDSMIFRYPKI